MKVHFCYALVCAVRFTCQFTLGTTNEKLFLETLKEMETETLAHSKESLSFPLVD